MEKVQGSHTSIGNKRSQSLSLSLNERQIPCIQPALPHGSEMWAANVEDMWRRERKGPCMIHGHYNISVHVECSANALRDILGYKKDWVPCTKREDSAGVVL